MEMSGVYMQWLLLRIEAQLHECVLVFSSKLQIPQSADSARLATSLVIAGRVACEAARLEWPC